MSAILKTISAVVETDGTVRLSESVHLSEPASAVVTLLIREDEPNAETRAAIDEPVEGLRRFTSVGDLVRDLES